MLSCYIHYYAQALFSLILRNEILYRFFLFHPSLLVKPGHFFWYWMFNLPYIKLKLKNTAMLPSLHVRHRCEKRTALFRVVTQRVVVMSYWRFGTIYSYHLRGSRSRLTRNVGKELPLFAALQPRRPQFSSTSWWKPEITQTVVSCRLKTDGFFSYLISNWLLRI